MASLKPENETVIVNELVDNIKKKKSYMSDKKTKSSTDNINQCKAAKKITTYGIAYQNVLDGKEVYLVKDKIDDNKSKISAYLRCSKTISDTGDYCCIHLRTSKLNGESLKNFETDIMPNPDGSTDKLRWLATIKDDYFDNMRKKKEQCIDPILVIQQNKKSKAYELLLEYAKELIVNNLNNETAIPKKRLNRTNHTQQVLKTEEPEEQEPEEQEPEEQEPEKDTSNDNTGVDEVIINNVESEYEELDGDEFVEVISNNGSTYYIKDNIAFAQNDDDNNDENATFSNVGIFTETKERYHTIKHDSKFYTIFYEYNDPNKGNIKLCVISKKIYNEKMLHIGNGIKLGSGTNYDLNYF